MIPIPDQIFLLSCFEERVITGYIARELGLQFPFATTGNPDAEAGQEYEQLGAGVAKAIRERIEKAIAASNQLNNWATR